MSNVRWLRGKDFENEIRRSCSVLPDTWRLRITDGMCSGPRPADMLLITPYANYLMELKRRVNKHFHLKYLEKHQIEGLMKFGELKGPNFGLVLFSIERDKTCETYAVDIKEAVEYCQQHNVMSIPYEVVSDNFVKLPEITVDGERAWDLQPMLEVFS